MSSNDTFQPNSADTSEWNRAWQAVAKLATARESLQEIPRTHSFSQRDHPQYAASNPAVTPAMPTGTIENDQLAGALAEIEEASAALRRSEPLLEHRPPALPARSNPRRYWSVWILIGAIWISATFVVATAAGAILYILG